MCHTITILMILSEILKKKKYGNYEFKFNELFANPFLACKDSWSVIVTRNCHPKINWVNVSLATHKRTNKANKASGGIGHGKIVGVPKLGEDLPEVHHQPKLLCGSSVAMERAERTHIHKYLAYDEVHTYVCLY